jgi:hypothetical protein
MSHKGKWRGEVRSTDKAGGMVGRAMGQLRLRRERKIKEPELLSQVIRPEYVRNPHTVLHSLPLVGP